MKSIIMNMTLEELEVINTSLDLLKHEYGVDVTVCNTNIQQVIERVDIAIDKIECEEVNVYKEE